MTYQSLYRRFRPQRFADMVGQEHVSETLRNAVRNDRVAHAYLFCGPRGCGKTTSARILAKALNCTDLQDGEPCGSCDSCVQVAAGTSMDVIEMDAASNNGVDTMRELVSRASLGTAGRRKVYILDEVHMLSTAASNTLLKTLEEPPPHVVFVLATTDPQKVLPTIRSRTQVFEFRLFAIDALTGLVRDIATQAGLDLDDATLAAVAKRGNGSARDALSALDSVAAAGGISDAFDISELAAAVGSRDVGEILRSVDRASERGRDPRQLARDLIEVLRDVFLIHMGVPRPGASDDLVRALTPAASTRALEVLGETLIIQRDAIEPRLVLETALVRLANPDLDTSPAALVERLDRLERLVRAGNNVSSPAPSSAQPEPRPTPRKAPPAPAAVVDAPAIDGPATEGFATTADGPTTDGPATTVYGPPATADGPATTVYGPPATADGPAVTANRPTTDGAATTADGPAVTANRPATTANRPATTADGPPATADGPAVTANRPTTDGAATTANRPATTADGPPATADGPAVTAGRPPTAVDGPPATADGPEALPSEPALRPSTRPGPMPSLASSRPAVSETAESRRSGVADGARAQLGARPAPTRQPVRPAPPPRPTPRPAAAEPVPGPVDERDRVLEGLRGKARAMFSAGRFASTSPAEVEVALPNAMHLSRCEEFIADLAAVFAVVRGHPVAVTLVVDPTAGAPIADAPDDGGGVLANRRFATASASAAKPVEVTTTASEEHEVDLDGLVDAGDAASSTLEHISRTFPGAELVREA